MPSDLNLGVVYAAVRLRNEFTPEMQKVVAAAQKAGQEMHAAGRVLTLGLTAPLVGAAAAAVKASIDFESSFTGVRKTVNATEPELQALSDSFRALALELPTNVNELNKIGEAAGQLGIQTPNIIGFAETMAALGETTNLSADAAATSLARLANITGLQQDEFENLGSAIVGLGNNFATTESEIVDFGLRIAGAGELAGLSEGEILGIGTAMSSIGVQAEAGGTAVQKVLNEINQSVATGDEELRVFAEVAGMTAEQFAAAFRDDASGAFESFVTGLGTQGDKSFTVMEDLGLESERVIRAFLGLANSGDLLSRAMDEGTTAFEENSALAAEVALRYGTTASQIKILWNHLTELRIVLGNQLLPALLSLVDIAKPVLLFVISAVEWWSKWPGPLKVASLAVLALVAAVGPALLIGGTILTSWATLTAAFPVLGAALAAAGLKAKAFWVALSGPIGWVLGAIAAVTGAIFYFREELGLVQPAAEDMGLEDARQKVEALEERVNSLSGRGLPSARVALAKAREALKEIEAAAGDAGDAVKKLTKDNFPAFAVTLQDAEVQLAQAKDGLNAMASAGMVVEKELEDWVDGLEKHVVALQGSATESIELAEAIDALADKWTGARFDVQKFSAAFSKLTDEQRANKAIMDEVLSAYGAARAKIGPFNDELEHLWQTEQNATAEAELLIDATSLLDTIVSDTAVAVKALAKEEAALAQEAQAASDAFDRQRESLLGLPTPKAIEEFELLREVWGSFDENERQEATDRYAEALRDAADSGIVLSEAELAIIAVSHEAEASLDGLVITLAALEGGIGGATGQAINLFTSMRQHNDALEEGEEGFSKARMGAALFSGALNDLAEQVGGTAGAILGAASNIASAFATGGPVAGAIAALSEGVKGLFSLFGVSGLEQEGRKAAEAARDAIADTLNDGQMAEAAGNAGNAVHIAIRDAMIATGQSIEAAEYHASSLTEALWRAEKEGGPAVEAVRDRILEIVVASAEAVEAAAELADTIESLGDELAQLDRDIRLREIEANIEALETELEAELEIIDARIAGREEAHDKFLVFIDEQIAAATEENRLALLNIDKIISATEESKRVALLAIDAQIAAVKSLTAARLADIDQQLATAQGSVVDVSATAGIAKRLKIDLSDATVFGAQEASNRITALAEDISTLQKAGLSVSAGITDEFDAELRAAVASAQRFGVTVPESLQTIVSTFPDIELSAIAFGDGLTEAARRVKELEAARDEIQRQANERLAELALERQATEEQFNIALELLETERQEIETIFVESLTELSEQRQAVEDEFNIALDELMLERDAIERLFLDEIEVLTTERDAIEDSMVETIDEMRMRRASVEAEMNAAIASAAASIESAGASAASAAASSASAAEASARQSWEADEQGNGGEYGDSWFAGGTRGRFIDFGRESRVKLHGRERVVTESEGRREAETNAASLRGVEDRLDRLDVNLQRAIKRISTDVTNVVMTKSL